MKKIATVFCICILMITAFLPIAANNDKENAVLAHWRFQNQPEYCEGSIDTDELTFFDLSGNGNTLVTVSEGNGNQLDIFSWDVGVKNNELTPDTSKTALFFNNSLEQAQSVDPYTKEETAYNGAYTSGKYLETIAGAPLNAFTGEEGWTIEIIFKIGTDWTNDYNRYGGIFSRQGVVPGQDEPPISLAVAEGFYEDKSDSLYYDLQYVHITQNNGRTNNELDGWYQAEEWVHYMATSKGGNTDIYVNGNLILSLTEADSTIHLTDADYSWEVGVGRKEAIGEATKNEHCPEGLIRRLFCGAISEIRVTAGKVNIMNSLLFSSEKVPTIPDTSHDTEQTQEETMGEMTGETTAILPDEKDADFTMRIVYPVIASIAIIVLVIVLCKKFCPKLFKK
jgi:hypothetical protein